MIPNTNYANPKRLDSETSIGDIVNASIEYIKTECLNPLLRISIVWEKNL